MVTVHDHSKMDISEIRRENLRALMNDHFGGAKVRIADRLGKSPSYIARCLSLTIAPENRKKIGEEFARQIEETLGLNRYAMDQPLSDEEALEGITPLSRTSEDQAFVGAIGVMALAASPRSKSALEKIAMAADSGLLTEEDMLLLEVIANRLQVSTPKITDTPHQRLRKKLIKNDPISK